MRNDPVSSVGLVSFADLFGIQTSLLIQIAALS